MIDFLAEEPSEYGLSCVGSRGMTGVLTKSMFDLTEPGGERLGDALRQFGGDPNRIEAAQRSDIGAFLELHIEQGPILEARAIDIGLVTSIVEPVSGVSKLRSPVRRTTQGLPRWICGTMRWWPRLRRCPRCGARPTSWRPQDAATSSRRSVSSTSNQAPPMSSPGTARLVIDASHNRPRRSPAIIDRDR